MIDTHLQTDQKPQEIEEIFKKLEEEPPVIQEGIHWGWEHQPRTGRVIFSIDCNECLMGVQEGVDLEDANAGAMDRAQNQVFDRMRRICHHFREGKEPAFFIGGKNREEMLGTLRKEDYNV